MTGDEPTVTAGTMVDGYRIEGLIAVGGMGEVFRARDVALDRRVALKMVSRAVYREPTFVARFEREARAASAISHPNVAQIHAFGTWNGRPYFVMEYVEGRSLADIVRRDGRRSGSAAIDLVRQAAEGLRAASRCSVIHRDVKPANLVLDAAGRVKLVDFGLARTDAGSSEVSRADMILGTPAYMSPEQALGQQVDLRTDIYSLGATFYFLLAGEPPFGGDTPIAVMMRHVDATARPIRDLNPLVPEPVAAVLERMMAKDPADRYGSWDEVVADLDVLSRQRTGTPAVQPTAAPVEHRTQVPVGLVAAGAVVVAVVAIVVLSPPRTPSADATSGPAVVDSVDAEQPPSGTGAPGVDTTDREPSKSRPENPPGIEAFVPVLRAATGAKTLSAMRRLDVAINVYFAEHGVTPESLEKLADWYEMHPAALIDAWNHRIEYQPLDGPRRYRIRSRGADGVRGTADDIVIESGYVIQGEPALPTGG